MTRTASGPHQPDLDDWPGVFVRGDEALGYAVAIRMAQKHNMDMPTNAGSLLDGLARILESCRVKD